MSKQNELIIAAAGSGKTTLLVKRALEIKNSRVLITTFTNANEGEIRKKFIELNDTIPANVTIQSWFSFLLQHGVRPFQGTLVAQRIEGMLLVNKQSGVKAYTKAKIPIIYAEDVDFDKHYFNNYKKIYSDKISKFVIRCNQKSTGSVITRISSIYTHIFIDEVQDLAGYDLDIVQLLFKSTINVLLVGDPRQVTYLTHHERHHSSYKDGKIVEFVKQKCKKDNCKIDHALLAVSHRNNFEICSFSSKLYPNLPPSTPCSCTSCRTNNSEHNGIFLLRKSDVESYKSKYSPTVLRYKNSIYPEWNFGKSKGLGFDRVILYPTDSIIEYLKNGILTKIDNGKLKGTFDIPKFYVAITRAKYSVAIIYDYGEKEMFIQGIEKFKFE